MALGREIYSNERYSIALKLFHHAPGVQGTKIMKSIYKAVTFLGLIAALSGVPSVVKAQLPPTVTAQTSVAQFFNQGVKKFRGGDYTGAIEDFTEAIRLSPNEPEIYSNRGLARARTGDFQGALADYNQAIRIEPNYALGYLHRGIAFSTLRDYQKAFSDYEQALRLNPNMGEAYYNRGNIHRHLKENQAALADFEKAAELYEQQGKTQYYQDAVAQIAELKKLVEVAVSDWREFSSNAGGFAVSMPGVPEEGENTNKGDNTVRGIKLSNSSGLYFLAYSDLSETPSSIQIQEMIDSGISTLIDGSDLKLLGQRDISLNGYSGREFEIGRDNVSMVKGRIYVMQQRIYMLTVVTPQPSNAQRFLESFRFI